MEIDPKQYIVMMKRRWWIIAVCIVLFTTITAIYTTKNYRPIYQASSKLIINIAGERDQMGREQMDYGAIGINIALIDTYKEIIKTPAVLDKVVQRYPDLNLTAEQLIQIIGVSNINNTQIMSISARSSSQEKAVRIANAVTDVFQAEVPKLMMVSNNITILNRAKAVDNPIPVNQKPNQYIVLSFIAAVVVAVGIILLLDMMDDTMKTEEDIRSILGVSTLACIPQIKRRELKTNTGSSSRKKSGEVPHATTIQ